MKKLAIILAFLMLVPGAAFGMEMMNDSAMDDVTGQAGVSIAFDDVQIFMNIDKLTWVDSDGLNKDADDQSATESGGAITIQDFQLDVLKVNAITGTDSGGSGALTNPEGSEYDLQYDYASNSDQAATIIGSTGAAALSIDATAGLPVLTTGHVYNASVGASDYGTTDESVGGVLIGLPTVEISIPAMSLEPTFYAAPNGVVDYDDSAATTVFNNGASYGRFDISGITFTVLSGWMEIAPH